jgi:hypothetical protein
MKSAPSIQKPDLQAGLKARRGQRVAQLLAGSWSSAPSLPLDSAEELAEVAPLLLRSGGGGLAWRKVRHSELAGSAVAEEFQQAYRFQSIQAALQQHHLKQVIPILRRHGVEPVLVKGWAIARLYSEPGLRPYADLDLCVRPEHYAAAKAVLEDPPCNVDLHLGFGKFYDRQTDDIFARSQLVKLDDLDVRVLSAEDHLRFLCVHLLRHGAVRPLWLCDIAVLIQTRTADFDWERCLSGSRRQADWVACSIGLAHQLLGVDVAGTPLTRRAQQLPSWLVPAVLKAWGTPFRSMGQVAIYLRHPGSALAGLRKELPRHWPNPIEATMTLKGPFNELPRLPFQIGHLFSRTAATLAQLCGLSEAGTS